MASVWPGPSGARGGSDGSSGAGGGSDEGGGEGGGSDTGSGAEVVPPLKVASCR